MSLLSKVNLQKKADKFFQSGRAWKLRMKVISIQTIPITETKLELALSKFKLANKKNPRKLIEEIASVRLNMESQLATARNLYTLAEINTGLSKL
jgi:hypothetical protein